MQAYLYLYYYLCKYKNQNASVAGSICTFLGSLPPDALSTLEMNKQALRKSSTPPCGAAHTAQCSVHTTFYIHSYSDLEGFQTVVFASPMPPLQLAVPPCTAAMNIEKSIAIIGIGYRGEVG